MRVLNRYHFVNKIAVRFHKVRVSVMLLRPWRSIGLALTDIWETYYISMAQGAPWLRGVKCQWY